MDPLPAAVLFDRPPAHIPTGYTLLKVAGSAAGDGGGPLLVRIMDPAATRRLGRLAWLQSESFSSCTGWGRLGAEAWVVARPAGQVNGRTVLLAKAYSRSRWDFFWAWFGHESYRAPDGPPSDDR